MAIQTISADAATFNNNPDTFCPATWLRQFEENGGMWAVQSGKVILFADDPQSLGLQLAQLDASSGREEVKALILSQGRA